MLTKTTHKFLSLLFVSVLLFSFTKPVYQTNFSGTWTLNEGKSELGQFGARGAISKIVIDQKTDGISVVKTTTGRDGNAVETSETLVEGKESETPFFGAGKKKSVLKWAADGNTFNVNATIAMDFNGQSIEMKGLETWSLSADGKTLTLQNNITTAQGEFATKSVFDKK
ncbi:MAG: hypothetical protein V4557_20120 [Bacteroidota bacterium]